jgi:hypothetical protein
MGSRNRISHPFIVIGTLWPKAVLWLWRSLLRCSFSMVIEVANVAGPSFADERFEAVGQDLNPVTVCSTDRGMGKKCYSLIL